MTRTSTLLMILLLALVASACAGAAGDGEIPLGGATPGDGLDAPQTPDPTVLPVEPDGGIGDGGDPLAEAAQEDSDQPIPVEPDGGIGDGAGPPRSPSSVPDFGVSSETDSLSVSPYTSCWNDPESGAGLCSDGFPSAGGDPLEVDGQLVITFESGALTAELGAADPAQDTTQERIELPVVEENPGIWLIDVSAAPSGEAGLWIGWQGEQGDAFAFIPLLVS